MQRQLLHISILDSVCWNFRPSLLLPLAHVAQLPAYKRLLLRAQKRRMCVAALRELDVVTALHARFGGANTRFSAIIFNTFEAAVVLLRLCAQPDCPFDDDGGAGGDDAVLGGEVGEVSRERMVEAAGVAFGRLRALAEVSEMAALGARVVAPIFARAVAAAADPASLSSSSSSQAAAATHHGGRSRATPADTASSVRTATYWNTPGAALDGVAGTSWAAQTESANIVTPELVPEDFNWFLGLQAHGAGSFTARN